MIDCTTFNSLLNQYNELYNKMIIALRAGFATDQLYDQFKAAEIALMRFIQDIRNECESI